MVRRARGTAGGAAGGLGSPHELPPAGPDRSKSTPLRRPRRVFLYVAVALFLAMVVLLAVDQLLPGVVVGVLAVACVFAGSRSTGGA